MDCLLCPWGSPGKNTGVSCHPLLQVIFLTQGSNPGLLHCRTTPYHLNYQKRFLKSQCIIQDKLLISHTQTGRPRVIQQRYIWTIPHPPKKHWTLNIQKTKIMASSPITSSQIDQETMETVTDFIFLGSKIVVVSHWIIFTNTEYYDRQHRESVQRSNSPRTCSAYILLVTYLVIFNYEQESKTETRIQGSRRLPPGGLEVII